MYVLNEQTIEDLKAAAFSYRLIGSCGLDSVRVIKGQFEHTSIRTLNLGIFQRSFFC